MPATGQAAYVHPMLKDMRNERLACAEIPHTSELLWYMQ